MFPKRSLQFLLTAACALAMARTVRGQAVTAGKREYGTAHVSTVGVPGVAFAPFMSTTPFSTEGDVHILRTAKGGNAGDISSFSAPLKLPAGALIESLSVDACDDSGGLEPVSGWLVVTDETGAEITQTDTLTTSGAGCQTLNEDVTSKHIVVDPYDFYYLRADVTTTATHTVGLAGMIVIYKLQVSPAPATATFADVPTNYPYFRTIEALAASGITSGCGGGNFCPDQGVTRGEMSKFLANALGLYWAGD